MILASDTSLLTSDLDQVFARTEGLWPSLRGRAVFITGGTGFFGRWLLESFVEANRRLGLDARAVVLTRKPEKFQTKAGRLAANPSIRLVRGDVRTLDPDQLGAQLELSVRRPISHFIHAAADTTEAANRNEPVAVIQTLLEGTHRTLALASRTRAENLLLVSSGAVYGEQPGALGHIPEDYSGAPNVASPLSAYGEGKRIAELLCHAQSRKRGMNCTIARCFAFVGPYLPLDAHFAIGNFIRDARDGKTIAVKGDGRPFRSYLYAADLAAWLWTLLLHPKAAGTYNVGSDEAVSIRELAECVSHVSPLRPPVSVAHPNDPKRPTQRYVPDITRARRELGLDVWTALDESVQKTLRFHQTTSASIL